MVEGINDLIWSTDKNGAFSYLSPQFQTLFGLEVNEWIGKKFTDLVHPDDLDGLISAYKQSIRSQQKTSNIEFRHLHQNGDYIWVSINTTPIINSEGIVIGGHGILADISDRKVTEAALRASDQRWQFALERAGDGIFDWNGMFKLMKFSTPSNGKVSWGMQTMKSRINLSHGKILSIPTISPNATQMSTNTSIMKHSSTKPNIGCVVKMVAINGF